MLRALHGPQPILGSERPLQGGGCVHTYSSSKRMTLGRWPDSSGILHFILSFRKKKRSKKAISLYPSQQFCPNSTSKNSNNPSAFFSQTKMLWLKYALLFSPDIAWIALFLVHALFLLQTLPDCTGTRPFFMLAFAFGHWALRSYSVFYGRLPR